VKSPYDSGSSTVNSVPTLSMLRQEISPPCSATTRFAMERPSPLPEAALGGAVS
jgi:hypothetical protein